MFTPRHFFKLCLFIATFMIPLATGSSFFVHESLAVVTQQQPNSSKKVSSKPSSKKVARNGKKKDTQRQKNIKIPVNNFKGAILYNTTTKQITFERRANTLVPPASLTKILTMYTALDIMKTKKISPRTKVSVSKYAAGKGGSRMGLRPGDVVTIDDLFHGMAISSGNDAATALAEYFGKTEKKFVAMMNKKAKTLGMKKSTFKNASGLPAKGQFTTPRDMLTLAISYLSAYPQNLSKYHTFRTYTYKGQTSTNANPLLGTFQGADGLKTGFVNASGYNVIATSKRNGIRLIGVLLGAPTKTIRSHEITTIMEAGYRAQRSIAKVDKDRLQQKKVLTKNLSSQRQRAKKIMAVN